MIIVRTPYRVSFFGGGTDYPAWYEHHGGAVVAATIDKYCHVALRWLPPFFPFRHRICWRVVEDVNEVSEIKHPAVRACMQRLRIERGLELNHLGDLPARSGLGSSSAFTVGLLNALHTLQGEPKTHDELACEAVDVEQLMLRETVGVQDQIECAYGGLNEITINRDSSYRVKRVLIQGERQGELQAHLMLFFTGFQRFSSDIAADQIAHVERNEAQLRQIAAMLPQAVKIMEGRGRLDAFGELLHDAWLLKRGLSKLISTDEIDAIYAAARGAGALGGKLLGAGGGGFMLLFVKPADRSAVRKALGRLVEIPFNFEVLGTHVIHHTE